MDIHILGQQLVNGIVLGSTYGLIAIGYTMVYGIIGMINFAHGEVYMVSAYLTAILLALCSWMGLGAVPVGLFLTLLGTIAITGVYGWAIERVAYRPLRHSTRLAPLISAIGASLVLQNYMQIAQGAKSQAIPSVLEGGLEIGSDGATMHLTWVQIFLVVVAAISMAGLTLFIKKTSIGRSCRATQQDPEMAAILGINTDRVISMVFVIGAVMAAIAGVLITLNYGAFDFFVGFKTGIKAFTAAVLGGIGSLPGAMLGGLMLGLLESMFSGYVSSDYKDVFAFSMLVIFLIFRPSGILGKPEIEKV